VAALNGVSVRYLSRLTGNEFFYHFHAPLSRNTLPSSVTDRKNLIGSGGHLHDVGESAVIATLALTLLEGEANTLGSGLSGSGDITNLVQESASIATVTLAGLELEANTGRTGTGLGSTVGEPAHVATVALTSLEGKADPSLAVGAEVGESSAVGESAVVATLALAFREGKALLHTTLLVATATAAAPVVTHGSRGSGKVVGKSATITTVALALLEGKANVVSARREGGRHRAVSHLVRKSAALSTSALPLLKLVANS